MVKIANNVSSLGFLRDIRVVAKKTSRSANGDATANDRNVLQAAEDALRAREEAGYERGKREAHEECSRKLDEARREWEASHRNETVRLLEELNTNIQSQVSDTFKALEKHLIMLAAEAAIKLTSGIPIGADMVEAYVREAINMVEQDTEITVLLHPMDLALLEQHQSSLLNRAGTSPVLRFRSDEKIGRGGCVLESRFGELDARRETKIELLKKAVNE